MKTTKKLKRMVAGVLASLMAMSGTANVWAADTEENVHLSMAFWAEQSEIDRLDQLLEIWKADHPNVTLDYTYCAGPDYPTKLQVWFSSGKKVCWIFLILMENCFLFLICILIM